MKTSRIIFAIVLISFLIVIFTSVFAKVAPQAEQKPATNQVVTTNACIVTINNEKYDVTTLKRTHSGGDVFLCNTDMTNTFFSQHNQRFLNSVMLPFKVK